MRIEVAFEIRAHAKLPGERKFWHTRLPASVWVDLPEITGDEAPVALRVTRPGDPLEFRSHGGGLLRPWETGSSMPFKRSGGLLEIGQLLQQASTGHGPNNPFIIGVGLLPYDDVAYSKWDSKRLLTVEQASFAEVSNSNDREARALVARNAADLVVVDGVVWERTREPVYVVDMASAEDIRAGRKSARMELADASALPKEVGIHFRADDLLDVLAATLPDRDWDVDDPSTYSDRVANIAEVLDPSVLSFRYDQYPAFRRSMDKVVERIGNRLATNGKGAILAWCDLREAVQSQAPGEEIASAAERLLRRMPGGNENAVAIRESLERWRMAPIVEQPLRAPTP